MFRSFGLGPRPALNAALDHFHSQAQETIPAATGFRSMYRMADSVYSISMGAAKYRPCQFGPRLPSFEFRNRENSEQTLPMNFGNATSVGETPAKWK